MSNEEVTRVTPLPVVPGQIIGERYRIGSILGEGGMGVVCAATHVGLGTPVAIKLIRSDLKHDPESVLRFLNEARTAASLKGDHVARVYDVGQLESGEPYLVMERLDGIGLDAFIQEQGPLSQSDAVDILLQACEGLAEAHAVALVHRDIKPANLFLAKRPDGRLSLKILDFGISKRLLDSARQGLTDPGKSLGSPSYMSPEQMMNASLVDQRADVWSLGILLFELLTKELPFDGESLPQVCASVLTAPAPLPSSRRSDIDAGLDAVVLRCLEKDPAKRYASVAALADGIRPFGTKAIQGSAVAFAETQAVSGVSSRSGGASKFRSLSPLSSHVSLRRPAWSHAATAMGVVAAGALLFAFGWPYVRENLDASSFEQLARTRLPWDPVLGVGPLDDLPMTRGDFPAPSPIPRIATRALLARAVPSSAPQLAAVSAPTLTPKELRRRVVSYRSWQREQGLTALEEQPIDDVRARRPEADQTE